MRASDIIVIAVIVLIIGLAVFYIIREKNKGKRCIGCPSGGCSSGGCSGCNGACAGGCSCGDDADQVRGMTCHTDAHGEPSEASNGEDDISKG